MARGGGGAPKANPANQAKSSKPKPPKKKGGATSTGTVAVAVGVGVLACCAGAVLLWQPTPVTAPLEPPPKVEPVRAERKSPERARKSRIDYAPSAQASCKSKAATGECNGHQASWMRQHCRAECQEWQGMTQIQRDWLAA